MTASPPSAVPIVFSDERNFREIFAREMQSRGPQYDPALVLAGMPLSACRFLDMYLQDPSFDDWDRSGVPHLKALIECMQERPDVQFELSILAAEQCRISSKSAEYSAYTTAAGVALGIKGGSWTASHQILTFAMMMVKHLRTLRYCMSRNTPLYSGQMATVTEHMMPSATTLAFALAALLLPPPHRRDAQPKRCEVLETALAETTLLVCGRGEIQQIVHDLETVTSLRFARVRRPDDVCNGSLEGSAAVLLEGVDATRAFLERYSVERRAGPSLVLTGCREARCAAAHGGPWFKKCRTFVTSHSARWAPKWRRGGPPDGERWDILPPESKDADFVAKRIVFCADFLNERPTWTFPLGDLPASGPKIPVEQRTRPCLWVPPPWRPEAHAHALGVKISFCDRAEAAQMLRLSCRPETNWEYISKASREGSAPASHVETCPVLFETIDRLSLDADYVETSCCKKIFDTGAISAFYNVEYKTLACPLCRAPVEHGSLTRYARYFPPEYMRPSRGGKKKVVRTLLDIAAEARPGARVALICDPTMASFGGVSPLSPRALSFPPETHAFFFNKATEDAPALLDAIGKLPESETAIIILSHDTAWFGLRMPFLTDLVYNPRHLNRKWLRAAYSAASDLRDRGRVMHEHVLVSSAETSLPQAPYHVEIESLGFVRAQGAGGRR